MVEAMEVLVPWTSRMRLVARLRRAAMTCGPLRVRSWWWSLSKTRSRTQWRRFSIPQCPWIQAATASGWASVMRREKTRVDHLDALPTFEGAGASDLEHLGSGGEAHPGGGLDGLDGAPHPPTVAGVDARDGWDALPGQGLESTVQGLLVAFDRQHVVATLIADPLGGVHLGVHRIGGDHRPVDVQGFESSLSAGISLDLSATRCWVRTAPVAWSRAARR